MHNRLIFRMYALIAVAFWGISFVSSKSLLSYMDSYSIITARFGLAAVFLAAMCLLAGKSLKIKLHHIPHMIILAVCGIWIHQSLQVEALNYIDAVTAGWLISLSPVFTAILAMCFGEKMTRFKAAGMAAAFTGVVLVAESEGFSLTAGTGIGLMVLSTLNWAVYSLLVKKLPLPYPVITAAFYTSFFGALFMLPFTIRSGGWKSLMSLPPEQWLHLLFLAVFVSAAAYWLWGKALSVLSATGTAAFLYAEPLFTMLAGTALLGEKWTWTAAAGGVFILAGVYGMSRDEGKRLSPK
ncbi:EamA family transporter [Metabacillus mangrovi]|uniref:EamA family transporter n=1 Tax=Metabacillus mangrovi TaxID=1491830 RepID=UPI001390E4AE